MRKNLSFTWKHERLGQEHDLKGTNQAKEKNRCFGKEFADYTSSNQIIHRRSTKWSLTCGKTDTTTEKQDYRCLGRKKNEKTVEIVWMICEIRFLANIPKKNKKTGRNKRQHQWSCRNTLPKTNWRIDKKGCFFSAEYFTVKSKNYLFGELLLLAVVWSLGKK